MALFMNGPLNNWFTDWFAFRMRIRSEMCCSETHNSVAWIFLCWWSKNRQK